VNILLFKVLEACLPDLRVDSNGLAAFKGVPWKVNGENVTSPSLKDVQIK